ncbi:hypothetical protein L873DRAFT_1297501 [Choiromyces venosus 120613-1]|uniref:Uncharacterized protein n=1 Tax=Choiromyces venosus 120613-1 TaxID=1336337 RepID=A0A3N4JBU6_9PEZI|nr:hypothetical protein L873DRAFT_1297501 [Choiromyces venosus 120613-1]
MSHQLPITTREFVPRSQKQNKKKKTTTRVTRLTTNKCLPKNLFPLFFPKKKFNKMGFLFIPIFISVSIGLLSSMGRSSVQFVIIAIGCFAEYSRVHGFTCGGCVFFLLCYFLRLFLFICFHHLHYYFFAFLGGWMDDFLAGGVINLALMTTVWGSREGGFSFLFFSSEVGYGISLI